MSKYKIVEIFDSIEGEGKRSGQLATFVRTAGCNLRCSYCDTLYALSEKNCEYTELTSDEIISRLNPLYRKVTLTGGEPLFHPNNKESALQNSLHQHIWLFLWHPKFHKYLK